MNNTSLELLSLQKLSQQYINHVSFIIIAPIDIFTNVLIVLTIVLSKSLHNKSQYIILSHAIAQILYLLTFISVSIRKLSDHLSGTPEIFDQLGCVFNQLPMSFVANLVRVQTLGLALDRLLCITCTVFYKKEAP